MTNPARLSPKPAQLAAGVQSLVAVRPQDPAELGFPALLPVELALNVAPVEDVCAAYGLSRQDFEALAQHPAFVQAYAAAVESLKQDGMRFKVKAQLQAEELLGQSWKLIHDVDTPPAVKAALIKDTVRWAGYEPKGATAASDAGGTGLSIQINLVQPTDPGAGATALVIDAPTSTPAL